MTNINDLKSTALKATAQVAVEAILNDPDAYDLSTMVQVRSIATQAEVADLYLNDLRVLVDDRADREYIG